jgi:arylsulfatase A-like enzyme
LTGRYQARFGVEANIGPNEELPMMKVKGLPASESTIAELLRKSGYKTALFGKWHLGQGSEFGPTAHGFDQSLAFHTPMIDYFSHRDRDGNPGLYENDQLIDIKGYSTDIFTDRAVDFIDHAGMMLIRGRTPVVTM